MYLDDILVYSTLWKEHLQHLELVFKHLKEANSKIKLSKYQLFKQHIQCLGHLISKQGIQLLLEKVTAIQKLKEPNNIDELCHFLGFTGYYRKFIQVFADVTKPLNKLLIKDTKFQWSPQCQAGFEHLKKVPFKKPIL